MNDCLRSLVFLCALMLSALPALAKDALPAAANPALEKHVMAISEELRCLVCQNQTIADSHADLAIDLRNLVREKIEQGLSDEQIVDFMVERYGDFVLYRPPLKPITILLWFGPFALMLGGLGVLVFKLKSRQRELAPATMSDAERQRVAALLAGTGDVKEQP